LYTFLHFDSTPAIVTSVVVGLGIVFCGAAVVHNVFVWQKVQSFARMGKSEGYSKHFILFITYEMGPIS
jgi:hypothetical protein